MDITRFSIAGLVQALEDGTFSSRKIVEAYLHQMEVENLSVNAVCRALSTEAIREAALSDQRRQGGVLRSKLDGLPYVLKDIFCTEGVTTTCGSKYLEHFIPPYTATIVERLQAAGMILIGKTNLDEFAMGGSTETSIFGTARNPWDLARTVGGSSGGSAAAVAARMAPMAIGSDTGGSIRQPASYCGVCGLKPTYGRLSRYGLVAFASSLDTVGLFAQSVKDLAYVYPILAGHDPRDSTSVKLPPPEAIAFQAPVHNGYRIGVVREYLDHSGLDHQVRMRIESAIEAMRTAGAEIVELSLPHSHHGVPTYYIIAPSEASSNLSRFDGAHYGHRAQTPAKGTTPSTSGHSPLIDMYCRSRGEGFGKEVKRRIMLGTYTLSSGYYDAYYLKAQRVRRLIRRDYDEAFSKVDVLLGPTTPGPAFRIGEKLSDPVQMYLEDWYTVGANLAGIPAISIPCGMTEEGLPIGLQLQAAPLEENRLLEIAHWYQELTGYTMQFPESTTGGLQGKGSR